MQEKLDPILPIISTMHIGSARFHYHTVNDICTNDLWVTLQTIGRTPKPLRDTPGACVFEGLTPAQEAVFLEWANSLDESTSSQFLVLSTGFPNLTPGFPAIIGISNDDPPTTSIHTCARSINLPEAYLASVDALRLAMDHELQGISYNKP
jgi:hypothetical protein